MITYLTAFIFYTLAMIGILLLGFVVYKKIMPLNKGENKGMIKILDSLPIGNKKVLLVVKIKNEKFLIASGLEHTTFLSKLNDENNQIQNQTKSQNRNNITKTRQKQEQIKENDSQNLTQMWHDIRQEGNNTDIKNSDEIQNLINAENALSNIVPKMQQAQIETMQLQNQGKKQNLQYFDELENARLQKLQRKFEQLYNSEELNAKVLSRMKKADKQKIMRQLLKELNTDSNFDNSKIGNIY